MTLHLDLFKTSVVDQISQLERIQESTKPGEMGLVRDFTVQACGPELPRSLQKPWHGPITRLGGCPGLPPSSIRKHLFWKQALVKKTSTPRVSGWLPLWLACHCASWHLRRHSELPVAFVRRGPLGLVSTCALLVWVILWKAAANKQLKWSFVYTLNDSRWSVGHKGPQAALATVNPSSPYLSPGNGWTRGHHVEH